MDNIKLHQEAYSRAVELHKLGRHEEAARCAREAVRLAKQISATAGIPYSGSTAEALLELIENDLRAARMAAAGDISTLLRTLGTREWPQAVKALETMGAPAVLPLCDFVADPTVDVKSRGLAASALGGIADPRAIGPLLTLLEDGALSSDEYAMRNLIFALGEFTDPRIAAALRPLLTLKNQAVREAAEVVLAKFKAP